ncbi:MAG TPA: hypothetical protein VHD36_04525 [Pirellulales bacterium]|nr:hypothetical protein [Pirellulales bacterium]
MKFAQRVFLIAAAFGLLILPPMYFLEDFLGRQVPPPITHPEIYYGFVSVTLAWQIGYLLIGIDPLRYRPFMLLGAFAKGSFVLSTALLVALERAPLGPSLVVLPDAIFAVLFVTAYRLTGTNA